MRQNIPAEMRQLPQWVSANEDKVPINPNTGGAASVTDPRTWGTFEQACKFGAAHVGFVLTQNDPFTIIDLDDKPNNPCSPEERERQQKIILAFQSYTERSTSRTGYHVIVKGKVPAGARRDKVEVYSNERYMICTGDIINDYPVAERQELLDILYQEMTPDTVNGFALEDIDGVADDQDIFDMAIRASNGDKFDQLCRGEWQEMGYPSQSEADFALLSILAFYTRDNEQVRRLFRMSALGKRDKAVKDNKHLDRALKKIRAKEPPPVDFTVPPLQHKEPPVVAYEDPITLPPGLMGEVADYIYRSAVRPVKEVSLAAAIGLLAGVAGRSFNISGTGLNQYVMLLAKTGTGKEGAASGIDALFNAVSKKVPVADQFLGPRQFASGQAMVRLLTEKPCFVSVLGEFGLTLKQICDPRANGSQIELKRVLLELYSKSGHNSVLRQAVYSDNNKNVGLVNAPAVTLLGETTPEAFFDGLNNQHVAEGLVPRFLMIEYTGDRPYINKTSGFAPEQRLVDKLVALTTVALSISANQSCQHVAVDAEAMVLLDAFNEEADDQIRGAEEATRQVWNRAHLKALKLAALVAVGCNWTNPVVTPGIAQWAISFIRRDVGVMLRNIEQGQLDNDYNKAEAILLGIIHEYNATNWEDFSQTIRSRICKQMIDDKVIPHQYLLQKVKTKPVFNTFSGGCSRLLNETLSSLIEQGELYELSVADKGPRYPRKHGRMFRFL